ncbi:MAG: hypothetical protein WC799_10275 [Desulfobacteraceae bacterium]
MTETTAHTSPTTSKKSPLNPIYTELKTLEFRTMMFKTATENIPPTSDNPKEFMWAYQLMVDGFISDLEEGIQTIIDDELQGCEMNCERDITELEEKITNLEQQLADTKQNPGFMFQDEDRETIHTAIVYGHLDLVPGGSMTPDEKEQYMNAFHRLKLFLSCPAKEAKPIIESLPLEFKSLPDDRQQSPVSNAFFYSDVVKDKLIWFQNALQSPLPGDPYKRKSHVLALVGAGTHALHSALHSLAQLQESLIEGDDLIKKIEASSSVRQ